MNTQKACIRKWILAGIFFFLVFSLSLPSARAENLPEQVSACAKIENAEERLACFDRLSGRTGGRDQAESSTPPASAAVEPPLSAMEKHWDLNMQNRRHSFILRPYRPNYFLPVAYNSSPNDDVNLEYDPKARAQFLETKFQISLKAKVWQDFLQKPLQGVYDQARFIKGMDLWVGYTQLSFWQLYNSAFSAPFRDTNYEPEFIINFRSQFEIPGLSGTKLQYFNVAFNHQSNGRSRPLSRSWNRLVGNVGLERGPFTLEMKSWYRVPEDEADDDNPDLTRFMGHGELLATYYWEKQRIALMLRNNLRRENVGAVQVDWSVPPLTLGKFFFGSLLSRETIDKYFSDKFCIYLQYFNGYGEGLMDYNKSINRISAGIMIAEWN